MSLSPKTGLSHGAGLPDPSTGVGGSGLESSAGVSGPASWYDDGDTGDVLYWDDWSYQYQDAAATVPVTAAGQTLYTIECGLDASHLFQASSASWTMESAVGKGIAPDASVLLDSNQGVSHVWDNGSNVCQVWGLRFDGMADLGTNNFFTGNLWDGVSGSLNEKVEFWGFSTNSKIRHYDCANVQNSSANIDITGTNTLIVQNDNGALTVWYNGVSVITASIVAPNGNWNSTMPQIGSSGSSQAGSGRLREAFIGSPTSKGEAFLLGEFTEWLEAAG